MGILLDKTKRPDDETLKSILGNSYNVWVEIKNRIKEEFGEVIEEWKFYGAKTGWTVKLLLKKRNLFFFGPHDKHFIIGFVFGDKAVAEVEKSDLPVSLIEELKNARKYAEGRVLSMEIRKKSDIKNVIKLTGIKIKN